MCNIINNGKLNSSKNM